MAVETLGPTEASNLRNKSIFITGGASGLGLHAARFFAKAGAFVTIADIQDGSSIARELASQGLKVQFIHCDIASYDSQVQAFQSALHFSPTKSIDIVAAYAGVDVTQHLVAEIAATTPSLDSPPPPTPNIKALEVNATGTYYTAALALHYLRIQSSSSPVPSPPSKSLIVVSSLAGYIDDDHNTSYTSSKFASRGLFRALRARAHTELNIRVNLVAPWAMKTPMTAPILEQMAKLGIEDGKGITFVEHDVLTQAVARIAADEEIVGRAFAVVPEGAVDLRDDLEGGYGGPKLQKLMRLRKEAGDYLSA